MLTITFPASASAAIIAKLRPAVLAATRAAMPKVSALIVDRISSEADRRLHSVAAEYKRGLASPDAIKLTDVSLEISLMSPIAAAFELGTESFDIKAAMLPHATKFGKDGSPYIDVPFQHSMSNGAVNMPGVPADVRASMARAVTHARAIAKRGGATPSEVSAITARLKTQGVARTFVRKLRIGGKELNTTVKHKSGIHDGMIRTAVMGAKRAIGTYQTIRRISAKSAATSWWHPGFPGVGIFKTVMPLIRSELNAILKDSFAAVGLTVKL